MPLALRVSRHDPRLPAQSVLRMRADNTHSAAVGDR
jgi:hypothetical protein